MKQQFIALPLNSQYFEFFSPFTPLYPLDNAKGSGDYLFIWGLSSHSRIFHSYAEVTITSGRLQILNNARNSWPLSSEGSLAFHTYSDTGHPFLMVISEEPWHSNPISERLAVEL